MIANSFSKSRTTTLKFKDHCARKQKSTQYIFYKLTSETSILWTTALLDPKPILGALSL